MHLEEGEADALRALLVEMQSLLDDEHEEEVTQRLFPPAYDNPDEERAYRDLVGDALREQKDANLKTVAESLGPAGSASLVLGPPEIDAWLAVLTDLRLALGTRLEVTEESMAGPEPQGPDAPAYRVLHWLGWLQESILREMGH